MNTRSGHGHDFLRLSRGWRPTPLRASWVPHVETESSANTPACAFAGASQQRAKPRLPNPNEMDADGKDS